MTDIDRDLIFGIAAAIVVTVLFGVTGIISVMHGHVALGIVLVALDVFLCGVIQARP